MIAKPFLYDRDHTSISHALPRQTQRQCAQLRGVHRQPGRQPCIAPRELARVQPARCQPYAHTVVHEHLHAVRTRIGKQISVMRVGCAKDLNNPRQCSLWPCAHVQRLGGHPDGIDADQRNSSKSHWVQGGGAAAGQCNLTDRSPRWISTCTLSAATTAGAIGSVMGNSMKAGNALRVV
jgi:hypothetical protein